MVTPLDIVFFGTPAFAERSLAALVGSPHRVTAVVTQPDRPRGRGQKLTPSPVKAFAASHAIHVLQPERMKDEGFVAALRALAPDLAVVAAYGKILPQSLIDLPRLGTINVHGSLLPRWRGAAPVHRAILAGDRETGVTIMRLVQALDAGPMLSRVPVTIGENETSADLERRLADAGAALLVETTNALARGPVQETPQPAEGVTYAHRLERKESAIDWTQPAADIHNRIRGLQPWPLAVVLLHGRRLALLGSEAVADASCPRAPGTVVHVSADAIDVAAGSGIVRLTRVQLEGKPAMAVREFMNGHRMAAGDRLEPLPVTP